MKSYILLGLGRFGVSFGTTMFDMGQEVLGIDIDPSLVQTYSNSLTHTIEADATSEDFLKDLDIQKFDAAIVAIGSNFQVSIMVTVLLKELGAKYILAKAKDDFQAKVLYKIGADQVILPEKDIGIKVAKGMISRNYSELIELSPDYSIINIYAPESWCGNNLGALAVRTRYKVNVIAVKSGENTSMIPHANTIIKPGDVITVMGENTDLKKVSNIK